MRRSYILATPIAALSLAGVLSSCASSPKFRPTLPLPTDKAVLYIYRPSKMLGGLVPITLSVDGQKVVNIFSGDYHNLTLNPGQHYVALYGKKSAEDSASFTAVAGREHYVKVEPSFGGGKVSVVNPEIASAEIASCHQPD